MPNRIVSGILLVIKRDIFGPAVINHLIFVDTTGLSTRPVSLFSDYYVNGLEDVRLVCDSRELHMVGNYYNFDTKKNIMAILSVPISSLMLTKPLSWNFLPLQYQSDKKQKNWIPFNYQNRLLFVYSLEPHVILGYDKSGICSEIAQTSNSLVIKSFRGGSQAKRWGDYYLAFIHKRYLLRYETLAYMFEAKPPFAIKYLSKPFILRAKENIQRDVQFVSGFEITQGDIVVTYGSQDRESKIVVITEKTLRDVMQPV